jgi:hypothetical protein
VRTAVGLLEKSKSQRLEIERLEKLLRQLRPQLSDLAVAVTKERDRPKDAILVVGSSGGVGTGLRPSFVECRSDRLVIHSPLSRRGEIRAIASEFPNHVRYLQERNRQTDSATAESQSGELTGDALQRTENSSQETWSIVFLIRPDGVEAFQSALPHVIQRDVRDVQFGYLPLPGDGPIDFSLWELEKR